jgi:hypothetical protein
MDLAVSEKRWRPKAPLEEKTLLDTGAVGTA